MGQVGIFIDPDIENIRLLLTASIRNIVYFG